MKNEIPPLKEYYSMKKEVMWFAIEMEMKLLKHLRTKRKSWKGMDIDTLFSKLIEEVGEIAKLRVEGGYTPEEMILECADAANILMMIADNQNSKRSSRKNQ